MQASVVLVCFVLVVIGGQAQVATMCRAKERFLMCGCPRTCRDPTPDCQAVCKTGCFCNDDEVRDDDGNCIKLADCPPMKSAYRLDTSEPRANDGRCPPNEVYKYCETCLKSCENRNPICPAQCIRGCFCRDGLFRNKDGVCVTPDQCDKSQTPAPIQYQMTCSEHQVYKKCETCEKTCSNPNPTCPQPCAMGCFCENGFVKSPNGQCVKLEDCPKAEVMIGTVHDSQEPSVEDCAPDEEYFSCGWCEPSCSNPAPSCPVMVCTRGCLCRPPLLRHHSGHCVEENNCFPQKCKDPNEEYVCRYGCEPHCEARPCIRPRRCLLGCHCRLGLLRDSATGLCVLKERCSNTNTSAATFFGSDPAFIKNYAKIESIDSKINNYKVKTDDKLITDDKIKIITKEDKVDIDVTTAVNVLDMLRIYN